MLAEPTTLNSVPRVVADTLRERYGVDPAPLLAVSGLDGFSLHTARGRVAFARMQQLWQAAAAASQDPAFGLRAGERVLPTSFGVLSISWMASDTLRDALRRLCRYSSIISTAPHELHLEPADGMSWLHLEYSDRDHLVPAITADAFFAAITSMVRMVTRSGVTPLEVRLQHGDHGQADAYEEVFACTVRFDSTAYAMAFDDRHLDRKLVGHESDIALSHEQMAERYLKELNARPVATAVQRLLTGLLPSGQATLDEAARRMNKGLSTLQRQLQMEDVTFRQVLEDTRRRLAEGYLADPRLTLGEVAYLLGFSDQSSFSRAFTRWTGQSPRQYRQRS